jgi:hypothetical protein
MSKLDRQLDEVYGEERVVIRWPRDEVVDVDEVRKLLISNIDSHAQRVPLDLRSVDGAPPALIDLLLECQVYARSQGKLLSISIALPPMQDALSGRRRKSARVAQAEDKVDAGSSARKILSQQLDRNDPVGYDISKAEKLGRRKRSFGWSLPGRTGKKRPPLRFSRKQVAVVAGAALAVLGLEAFLIFHDPTIRVEIDPKSFERSGAARREEQPPAQQPVASPSEDGLRIWSSQDGLFKVSGYLTGVTDGVVYLSTEDGQSLKIQLDQLSEQDRQYVESLSSPSPFVPLAR